MACDDISGPFCSRSICALFRITRSISYSQLLPRLIYDSMPRSCTESAYNKADHAYLNRASVRWYLVARSIDSKQTHTASHSKLMMLGQPIFILVDDTASHALLAPGQSSRGRITDLASLGAFRPRHWFLPRPRCLADMLCMKPCMSQYSLICITKQNPATLIAMSLSSYNPFPNLATNSQT